MVTEDKDKKILEENPMQGVEKNEESTPSWMDSLGMSLDAAQQREAQTIEEHNAKAARFAEDQAKRQKALSEGRSLFNAMIAKKEPVYDEGKEKRLRNRAVIQSLGDILSAVASGAIAFGGRGQGYVPTLPKDSALASLEEVNKMRKEYATAKKEWDEIDLGLKQKALEAQEAAHNKLSTAEEAKLKEARDRVNALAKERREVERDLIKADIRATERAEDRKWKELDREDRQANTVAIKALGPSKGSQQLTEEGNIHRLLTAGETYTTKTKVPKTRYDETTGKDEEYFEETESIKPKTYTIAEHNAIGKYDVRVKKVKEYMAKGMSIEDAVAKVLEETKK